MIQCAGMRGSGQCRRANRVAMLAVFEVKEEISAYA